MLSTHLSLVLLALAAPPDAAADEASSGSGDSATGEWPSMASWIPAGYVLVPGSRYRTSRGHEVSYQLSISMSGPQWSWEVHPRKTTEPHAQVGHLATELAKSGWAVVDNWATTCGRSNRDKQGRVCGRRNVTEREWLICADAFPGRAVHVSLTRGDATAPVDGLPATPPPAAGVPAWMCVAPESLMLQEEEGEEERCEEKSTLKGPVWTWDLLPQAGKPLEQMRRVKRRLAGAGWVVISAGEGSCSGTGYLPCASLQTVLKKNGKELLLRYHVEGISPASVTLMEVRRREPLRACDDDAPLDDRVGLGRPAD
ncbi:MAG: hypothetical protein HY904_04190 [Deltaproteobacteria bacterium]|nr:hypothetical protein [Deltaproteobacteria bacterium]